MDETRTNQLTKAVSSNLCPSLVNRQVAQVAQWKCVFCFEQPSINVGFWGGFYGIFLWLLCQKIPLLTGPILGDGYLIRHTCATQLVNAGCPITTIQSVLGHRQLSATLVYARVHDRTVAEDYYAAMAVIEERLAARLNQKPERQPQLNGHHPGVTGNTDKLLRLLSALQVGSLSEEQRAVVTELQQELLSLAV